LFGLLLLYVIIPADHIMKLYFLMFIYFIPPMGKESVIPLGILGGDLTNPVSGELISIPSLDPFTLALSIAFVDICVALFIALNYNFALGIPAVGSFMKRVEKMNKKRDGQYGWLRPLRFFGIVLFVVIPFQGSGGLVGSIVGRFIGLTAAETVAAISIGAIGGCLLIAYFAQSLLSLIADNLLFILIAILCLVGIGLYFYLKPVVKSV
jgi:uncharacterized membrane protein